MKLTAKIKLLPTSEQAQNLLDTLSRTNQACNALSEMAWENKQLKQFGLHKLAYYPIKEQFALSADHNGALNIAAVGASVTWPENSTLFCALHRC
ncbi:hypothetical protein DUE52_02025 [Larkinella punicea]|uniref:Transposase n=1 Tax=Larkinella punicea TaxID=2315727 RepID=A0A368JUM1_9BACT|nr:hypothetical protein DUE52_02025 [Larkinella punicea]